MAVLQALVIKILGDTAGLEAAVAKSQTVLDKLGKAADSKLGRGLKTAAKIGAGAVVTEFGLALNAVASFEHAVDQVGAVANATEPEMKQLADAALRIGKDTAFSATEAAQAMEILAANGISVTDILAGAADATVALAAAGGTDLKTAADTASTAMAVWGLRAEDLTEVVNRLAGAANVSRFGVEDMSLAIAQGGGAAASAGVEFADFATAIAAIAPSFSSGADAGTSFKAFLNGLTPTSDKAAGALAELGLITKEGANLFFDAQGKLKSMAEITDLLHNATKGLTEQQKAMALETIFGSDALRTAAALAKLTGEEFERMSNTMRDTSAAEVAAQRMGNLKGSMEALSGSVEALQISIGMALLPVAKRLVDFANSELVPAGEKVFRFLDETRPVAYALAVALGVLLVAMFPIPSAIAAIVVGGALLINHWDELEAQANALAGSLRRVWETEIPGPIRAFVDWIAGDVVTRLQAIVGVHLNIFRGLADGVQAVLAVLRGDWGRAWEELKSMGERLAEAIVDSVVAIFGRLPSDLLRIGKSAASEFLRGLGDVGVAGISINDIGGAIGSLVPKFDAGTPFVQRGGLAVVHRGEAIIPARANPFSGGAAATGPTIIVQGSILSERDILRIVRDAQLNGSLARA